MSMKPITIIVEIAPINHSSPAVPKIFSPDFMESVDNDFLKNIAVMIKNTKNTMKATKMPITIGSTKAQKAF